MQRFVLSLLISMLCFSNVGVAQTSPTAPSGALPPPATSADGFQFPEPPLASLKMHRIWRHSRPARPSGSMPTS